MDDYKILLGAILDANAKGDLQKSIDAIKDLNVKISKAELSQSAIADIKRQFEKNGIDLKVVFGNTSQIINQAKQTGQQVGKEINQGLSQSMGNSNAIIERFKKSLSNTGMDTRSIDTVINRLKSLDVQIDSLNQKVATVFSGENYGEDILSVDVSGVDKMGQAVKIMDQYNLATGEYLKTVQSVSTAQAKSGNSVEEFANKQKKAIASLQNDYNKVLASSLDSNSSRPITSDSSYKALEQQIDKVEIAMSELKSSTATTFDDAKIRVQEEISNLKILEKQLRNADNVSTKLRGNSVDTGFGIAINDLEKLKSDSKEYDKMSGTIQNLEKALENVSDSASLNKFNDGLREARAELAKLKSEAMADSRAEKVGINVSDFQSKINDLKRISPEINDFKTQINGAEVSVVSLVSELSNVKTQGDISVLNTKWRAFTDAAKAEGIAVKETGQDGYNTLYNALKRLYDLKKEYLELKGFEGSDSYYPGAIHSQEEFLEKLKSSVLGKDSSKDDEFLRQEIRMADELSKKVSGIKLKVEGAEGVSEYKNSIEELVQKLVRYGNTSDEALEKTRGLKDILSGFKDSDGNWLPDDEIIMQAKKMEDEFSRVKVLIDEAKLSYDKFNQPVSNEKASGLINRINTFLTKNTRITKKARTELEGFMSELRGGNVSVSRFNQINGKLKETENSMRGLHRLGASFKDQMTQAASSFTQWLSVSTAVMALVSKTREAVTELKEVDTYLTEISKTNDTLTKAQLKSIGDNSFETASKYGKKATDYLSGVQEMSRAGYQNAEAMGELSVKAQGAGDMTEDVANKFIVATDKAYKLNGLLTDLTEIMDGINNITNHNAVNMTELSEGFSVVGSTAASFGVDANELAAVLGTMTASTQQSGSEVARAFKAILLNIRQVSDEEENIDAEGLTKYEEACNALGVKLKETKNGVQELRAPMEVLKELSVEYNKLSDTDVKKVNLLNSVGGKLRSTQLDALLRGWSDYEKMLGQFADGSGSMAKEAEKTANSWEGSMNRLSNTWTDTIGNIADSDLIVGIVNGLNEVLSVVNNISSALGSFGTLGVGAGLFAGIKNIGRDKM